MNTNPFKQTDGTPIEGKLNEFIDWETNHSINHLKSLPLSERIEVIENKLRIAYRMQSEATETPDFDTWRKEAITLFKDLLEP